MDHGGRVRGMAAAAIVGLFGLVIGASMSDRVPRLARQYKRHIPLPDWMLSFNGVFGIHFLLWSTLAFGSVLLVTRWRVRLLAAALLFLDSVLLELLQDRYTAIRRYQHIDLAANAVGIAVGVIAGYGLLRLVELRSARRVGGAVGIGDRAGLGLGDVGGVVPSFAARTDDQDAPDEADDPGSLPQDGTRR